MSFGLNLPHMAARMDGFVNGWKHTTAAGKSEFSILFHSILSFVEEVVKSLIFLHKRSHKWRTNKPMDKPTLEHSLDSQLKISIENNRLERNELAAANQSRISHADLLLRMPLVPQRAGQSHLSSLLA